MTGDLAQLLPRAMLELLCALNAGTIRSRVEIEGDETRWWSIPQEFWNWNNIEHIIKAISPTKKCLPHSTAKFLWKKFLKQKGRPPSLIVTFDSKEMKMAFPIPLLEQERMLESKMKH
jgi:hypothetical protein